MANIKPLQGPMTLREMYPVVNENITNVNAEIVGHKASGQAHAADTITYNGNVPAASVKEAIDKTDQRISTIVAQAGDSNTEIVDARGGAPILGDRLNSLDAQLADIAVNPKFLIDTSTIDVTLGNELLTNTWTLGAGWTGDLASGFTHASGNTASLSTTISGLTAGIYRIELTVTPAGAGGGEQSDFWVTLGGSPQFETYKGPAASRAFVFGIETAATTNVLDIIPWSNFAGSIKVVSLKKILLGTPPSMLFEAYTNNLLEYRSTNASGNNTYLGKNSGRYNVGGEDNVSLGNDSLANNTSGYWNVVIGVRSLQKNTVGSRNVGIGRETLRDNTTGTRNNAIGSFALSRNTTGVNNVAIGTDTMYYNTTGSYNTAVGKQALANNVSGNGNVAIGDSAMLQSDNGINNVALGRFSLHYTKGENNIAAGWYSSYKNIDGGNNVSLGAHSLEENLSSHNIGLGYRAARLNTTGSNNIAIGRESLLSNLTSQHNIAIGTQALHSNTGEHNIAMGYATLSNNLAGEGNVAIGYRAMGNASSKGDLSRNVVIGKNAGVMMTTGANNNVIVGSSSGATLTTGASNILLGNGVNTPTGTTSNYLNIGNVIKGSLTTGLIELQKLLLSALPTSDPAVAGQVWNSSGTLRISAG